MLTAVKGEPPQATAAWKVAVAAAELRRWLSARLHEDGLTFKFGAAKQIAALALHLRASLEIPVDEALSLSAAHVGAQLELSRPSLKKNVSEARAIVEFGEADAGWTADAGWPVDVFEQVHRTSLKDVRQRRKAAFGGAKGGRPADRPLSVLDQLRRLVQEAATDPRAAEELRAIHAELRG